MLSLRTFASCALLLLYGSIAFAQQTESTFQYEDPESNVKQMADLAGLTPLLEQLLAFQGKQDSNNLLRMLLVRQQFLERVTAVSLQADASIARIEGEVAQANEYRGVLEDRRDRRENRLNLAGIGTGGALGVVSSALQISAKHAKAGNSVGIGAGVIVTVLSVMSLRAQNGKAGAFSFRSNMLAPLLSGAPGATDVYSPAVLRFLDAVPKSDPDHFSRKERLVKTWQEVGRLPDLNTSPGRNKADRLTETAPTGTPLTIADLYDRRAMLEDLRAKLALMKRDLAAVLMSAPQIDASSAP